jgi:cytidyltransferase-like protein
MWEKKVHVSSSMPKRRGQYAMFIGRWQPLHEGHIKMFQEALNDAKRLLIAIRDMPVDDKNPYSSIEVRDMIRNHYKELVEADIVNVIIIPDICSVEFGRGVGYDIIEHIPPPEIGKISATEIRKKSKSNL